MKIPLGHDSYLEPDEGPRNTVFHKRIIWVTPIPATKSGNQLELECGHVVTSFGNIDDPMVLCTQCRDREAKL